MPQYTISTVFKAFDQMSGPMAKMGRGLGGLNRTVNMIKTALVGGALLKVGASFVSAAADVEKYKTTLKTMLGSQEAANARFDEMSKFAASTPFELNEVVELGNQLQALGRYSVENMTMLGDLASAAGKPIDQVTGAFAKLASGQKGVAVDMFRDLLVTTQDWVKYTGKGVSKSGELLATTEEMIAALPRILGAKGFSGMMEQQSKTWNGLVSNLKDGLTRIKAGIGEALLGPLKRVGERLIPIGDRILAWVNANKELIGQKVDQFVDRLIRTFERGIPVLGMFMKAAGWLISNWPVLAGVYVAWQIAQWALNGALAANPIGAVVLSIEAMIVAVVTVIRYWDEITTALRNAWNWINRIFNNPALRIAMTMFAQPILLIVGAIQTLVDLLSGEGWKSFLNMAGPIKAISDALGITKKGGQWGEEERARAAAETPVSPMSTETRNFSTVDVNLNGLPIGSTVQQRGKAQGVTVNTGFSLAGARW